MPSMNSHGFMDRIHSFLCKSALSIAFMMTMFITVIIILNSIAWYGSFDNADWMNSMNPVIIIASIIIAIAIFGLTMTLHDDIIRLKPMMTGIACTAIIMLTGIAWTVFAAGTELEDSYELMEIAATIHEHGFLTADTPLYDDTLPDAYAYITHYPYQSGVLLYMMPMMMFTGASMDMLVMRLISAIIIIPISGILIGMIAREIAVKTRYNGNAAFNMTMIMLTLYSPFAMSSYKIYGNILDLPFLFLGILMIIKLTDENMNTHAFIRSAMILFISVFGMLWFKTNMMITVIAMIIILILGLLKHRKRNLILIPIIIIAAILGSIIPVNIMQSFTDADLKNSRQPAMSWIAMGTDYNPLTATPGFYQEDYLDGAWNDDWTPNKASETARRLFNEHVNRLNENNWWIQMLARKTLYSWSEPSFAVFGRSLIQASGTRQDKVFTSFMNDNKTMFMLYWDGLQMLVMVLACIMLFQFIRMHECNETIVLPAMILIGGFLFHYLWETQPEYAYTYFLLMFPYAGILSSGIQLKKYELSHKIRKT